jgi:GMP synthase (glutamine-hydrolysing)
VRLLAIVHEESAGLGVFADAVRSSDAELVTWAITAGEPEPESYDAVITLGGAVNTDEEPRHRWIGSERAFLASLLERRVPVLAVCLGAQILAEAVGGSVGRMRRSEIGWYEVAVAPEAAEDPLLGPLAPRFDALEWHHYGFELPPGATELARSEACVQAYRVGELAWGVQFHPEVTLADFEAWVDGYRRGEDTGGLELDPDELLAGTRERIDAWSALGRELCSRFIAVARGRAPEARAS